MATKKNLVKSMLMSVATAGIFSFSFVFTSCNDDDIFRKWSHTTRHGTRVQRSAAGTLRTVFL